MPLIMNKALIVGVVLLVLSGCSADQPASPEVTALYPSSDALPENLLRMYILFSTPMKTQGNLEKLKLYTSQGDVVEGAFLTTTDELWSPDQLQWTILLDPARVKTGLQAHEIMGRALVEGEHYELVIEGLEDVNHQSMAKRYVKVFYITKADTLSPSIDQWEIHAPQIQTTDPVTITFPDMLDQFSLLQRLLLTTKENIPIEGRVEIRDQETVWRFTPERRWVAGEYNLHINTRLADPPAII